MAQVNYMVIRFWLCASSCAGMYVRTCAIDLECDKQNANGRNWTSKEVKIVKTGRIHCWPIQSLWLVTPARTTHTHRTNRISIISFFFFIVVNWWLGMRANTSIRAMTITTRILNIFLNLYSFFNLFVCCFFLFNFVYLTTWLTITIRFWFSLTGVGADNKYNGQWQFFARIKWVNRS